MIERGDNSGVYQYGRAEHFTHIISDKPSPKDKYVAYAINIPTMSWQPMYIILT
ncbi:alpha-amylase [Escherichia coli]|nr:alpha-amylase [Escherichia coli]GCR85861.1 alpha-amylase [Escherichia coli]